MPSLYARLESGTLAEVLRLVSEEEPVTHREPCPASTADTIPVQSEARALAPRSGSAKDDEKAPRSAEASPACECVEAVDGDPGCPVHDPRTSATIIDRPSTERRKAWRRSARKRAARIPGGCAVAVRAPVIAPIADCCSGVLKRTPSCRLYEVLQ